MTIEPNQLLLLLNWMSPAFPTGAFAYSHGLEWAIEDGNVQSADDLKAWVADLVSRGSGWNDAVLFARCWDDDEKTLNELALALCSSRERWLETTQLGRSFDIAAAVFQETPSPSSRRKPGPMATVGSGFRRNDEMRDAIAYPVAAGTSCAALGIPKAQAMLAFLQGFCAAQVSVAVRLVPLGQTQGLEVLRDLMPVIAATAQRASSASLDDLGSITLGADIAAMKHETQHSRIFRT